ncbi:DUF2726 domain-containing protein [Stenotrophomonas panacihumi]|uniref:DUF2726 domain-containing protein n=1 Tax=Stenotrophomonas panacihumi TaxID=676599 RepID=UPI0009D73B13|nr:DUF2726 domain-containing protein [Stenotrophomonas panacihumi]PTN55670.1 DUF2726 domain-containing protein [Stenotrophomonas panacihumi]
MPLKIVVLAAFVVFAALAFAITAALSRRQSVASKWPLYGKRVLSGPEQALYWRLVEALPGDVVLAQVQLSRFLGIQKGNRRIEWLNRINQKSADFVVCHKDFSIIAVIELDDATHGRPSRQKADRDKEKALSDAGLRLIRWHVKRVPTMEEIQLAVHPAKTRTAAGAVTGDIAGTPPVLAVIRPD